MPESVVAPLKVTPPTPAPVILAPRFTLRVEVPMASVPSVWVMLVTAVVNRSAVMVMLPVAVSPDMKLVAVSLTRRRVVFPAATKLARYWLLSPIRERSSSVPALSWVALPLSHEPKSPLRIRVPLPFLTMVMACAPLGVLPAMFRTAPAPTSNVVVRPEMLMVPVSIRVAESVTLSPLVTESVRSPEVEVMPPKVVVNPAPEVVRSRTMEAFPPIVML